MDPKIVAKFHENIPEFRQFISFLLSEMDKLDRVNDIEIKTTAGIALEVASRKRAAKILENILGPLVNVPQGIVSSPQADDYSVDVK